MSIADKLITVAENVPKVYEQGYKQGEEDIRTFIWNTIQIEDYDMSYAFAGMYWRKSLFKPRKDLKPVNMGRMFAAFDYRKREEPLDLVEDLKPLGITLDFSRATSMPECFSSANITRLGVVDLKSYTQAQYGVFSCEYMKTIDKLILYEHNKYSSWFASSKLLENLNVEGVIAQNGFAVNACTKLTKPSIISIINALSTTTSGLTVTLSKTAVNNAFGINIDDPTTWAEGTEYYELRHSRDNWTITYV